MSELTYTVVINHEEQYSTWPADKDLPLGWDPVGVTGTREECLAHIESVWTDIRPKSLRERLAAQSSATDRTDR